MSEVDTIEQAELGPVADIVRLVDGWASALTEYNHLVKREALLQAEIASIQAEIALVKGRALPKGPDLTDLKAAIAEVEKT